MQSNTLFVKSKFEDRTEMENFESPSKSSPMNLSTRPIERNVLKEMNSLEGGTKSLNKVSASDDPEIQLKDPTNLSSNLPDIVTNVHADGNKVVNKNLLYVATPPDIQSSDDEFVDCDTTLKDNETELAVNKRIDKISQILDETIQILEREKLNEGFIEALSSSNNTTVKFPINNPTAETSENITEDFPRDSSFTDGPDGPDGTVLIENTIEESNQCIAESLLCEEETQSEQIIVEDSDISNKLNESKNLASAVDRPAVINEAEKSPNLAVIDTYVIKSEDPVVDVPVIESTVPVVESAVLVVEAEVSVAETALPVIESGVPVNDSVVVHSPSEVVTDSSALTETDVELNTLNQTHAVENLLKSDNSSTYLQETSFSLTNNKINQTVTIESNTQNLDEIVTEAATIEPEELTNTTEQKQLEKIHEFKANQTISVDSLDIDGETRECSLDSLEMKQPIHHEPATPIDKQLPGNTADEIFSKKQSPDLSEMFPNTNQTTNEFTIDPLIEKSTNEWLSLDKANSKDRLLRRGTFNVPTVVDSNDKSEVFLEEMPNIDTGTNELLETISQTIVSSPARSHQVKSELDKQMANEKSPIEPSINENIDITNRLKRRCTFNISNVPAATPEMLEDLGNFEPQQSLFQFGAPSLPILNPEKPKKEKSVDNNDSNFMVLNSTDFDFLQSRGGNCDPEDERRDSLLLRFDPLSGRSVHTTKFVASAPIVEETVVGETDLNGSEVTAGGLNNTGGVNNTLASQLLSTNETPSNGILVDISPRMDNEANGYLNNTRTERSDDKLISVDGVSLTDKKIKLACNDLDIQKKMEEYEATQEILLKRITEKDKAITKTSNVLELYEKAIAEALAAKEKLSQSYDKQHEELKTDRDVNFQHLLSLESTFADLHMKFERNVQYTSQLQEKLNAVAEEKAKAEDLLKQQEFRYDKMKSHTMQQFDIANTKLEQQTKTISTENTKLKAQIKREEIHKNAVQEELLQKKKENEELVKICDELISGQRS